MVLEDFKFLGVPCHSIGLDDLKVFMADDGSAKRIHFATSHANALRKDSSGNPFAWFNVPFRNTIEPLMKKELGSSDFLSQDKELEISEKSNPFKPDTISLIKV